MANLVSFHGGGSGGCQRGWNHARPPEPEGEGDKVSSLAPDDIFTQIGMTPTFPADWMTKSNDNRGVGKGPACKRLADVIKKDTDG